MNELKATLQTKNGMYYCVISYKDKEQNKWKLKWKTTKVLAKQGNKKKAKETFPAIIENFRKELEEKENKNKIENNSYLQRIEEYKNKYFLTFLKESIEEFRTHTVITTYEGWLQLLNSRFHNFFSVFQSLDKVMNKDVKREKYYKQEIKISELTQFDIEDFYKWLYDCGLKGSSVMKYHVLLNLVMKRAIRLKVFTLDTNPMKDIEKPTISPYTAGYYSARELNIIFKLFKGDKIEIAVMLAGHYGLRRSEVLGIRWSSIDFENKCIYINRSVIKVTGKGENQVIIYKDFTKNNDIRTLPLIEAVEKKLLEHKKNIEENKKFYGNAYITNCEEYVNIAPEGTLIPPNYITHHFKEVLDINNINNPENPIKQYKYHSLRHSIRNITFAKQC